MSDEWTTVKAKRANTIGETRKQHTPNISDKRAQKVKHTVASHDDGSKAQDIVIKCRTLSSALEKSIFFNLVISEIRETSLRCISIISLGIGQFTSSPSAMLQLAMILSIRKGLSASRNRDPGVEISGSSDSPDTIYFADALADGTEGENPQIQIDCKIFDPLFSPKECEVCNSAGLTVSDENRKGKHRAESRPTIFFMPHCPFRLYVNLLWENWDNLENVIILGNSFMSYGIRRSLDDDKTDCIRLLGPLITEKPVWDLFTKSQGKRWEQSLPAELSYLENAFCDLSIHTFEKKILDSPLGLKILALRPSEGEIDEAALQDVELFS